MRKRTLIVVALLISLGGCSRSYEILKAVEGEDGVYLTFPPGTHLYEGEIFRIVGAARPEAHGRLRPVLGRVRVLQVKGGTLAYVKILTGTVEYGVSAEEAE
jgi:hypothetical protein